MNRRETIRAAMAGAAAAVAAPAVVQAAGNPDAALIALCGRAKAAHEAWAAHIKQATTIEEEEIADATGAPLLDEAHDLIYEALDLKATTPEGLRAVADLAAEYCHIVPEGVNRGSLDRRLTAMLVRDARRLA